MAVKKKKFNAKKARRRPIRPTRLEDQAIALDEPKEKLSQARRRVSGVVLADIKRIRILWAKGWADMDIRRSLDLNVGKWKFRKRMMGLIPPDGDAMTAVRRYYKQHEKFIARQEDRMQTLSELYDQAKDRNRRLEQQSLVVQMSQIDERIRVAEGQLIAVLKNLGAIGDNTAPGTPDTRSSIESIRAAWRMLKVAPGGRVSLIEEEEAEITSANVTLREEADHE